MIKYEQNLTFKQISYIETNFKKELDKREKFLKEQIKKNDKNAILTESLKARLDEIERCRLYLRITSEKFFKKAYMGQL